MNNIVIRPGNMNLRDWRAIYRGASVTLDKACLAGVEKSAQRVSDVIAKGDAVYGVNTGFGKLASVGIDAADIETLQRNLILSHAAGTGAPLPGKIVRLMIALKVASLGQGASGVRTETLQMLVALLQKNILPVVPSQGSVGASGDLAPLAHMASVLIGVGEMSDGQTTRPAADVLKNEGLKPLQLTAKEGLALLNGTQFSTACALAALFEAESLFEAALVTGALSTDAGRGSDTPFDARIHALRGHRGQSDVAEALRELMQGSGIRESHRTGDDRIQDPYCLRCQPQVMGACLDVMRAAAATLETEANGVTDNPLVMADGDILSGGNFHAEPVAFAADMLALAICEIGSIAERRIALLTDPNISTLPAFLTPRPGLNSGFMIAQVTAAALVSENKQMAMPASVDSIPTSANQEDHVSMAGHGARRLLHMCENLKGVIAIEWLAAAQGCDFHEGLKSSAALEQARELLRAKVPSLKDDRYFHTDIEAAKTLLGAQELQKKLQPYLNIIRGEAA